MFVFWSTFESQIQKNANAESTNSLGRLYYNIELFLIMKPNFLGPPGIPGMDGLDGAKGYLGDKGEDCKVCPDGKKRTGHMF